ACHRSGCDVGGDAATEARADAHRDSADGRNAAVAQGSRLRSREPVVSPVTEGRGHGFAARTTADYREPSTPAAACASDQTTARNSAQTPGREVVTAAPGVSVSQGPSSSWYTPPRRTYPSSKALYSRRTECRNQRSHE